MIMKINNGSKIHKAKNRGSSRRQSHDRISRQTTNYYKAVHESMLAGLKPPAAIFDTFKKEAALIIKYKKHEEEFYVQFHNLCCSFQEAFEDNDVERMVELYNDFEILKHRHH